MPPPHDEGPGGHRGLDVEQTHEHADKDRLPLGDVTRAAARRVGRFVWERALRTDTSIPWETRAVGLLLATYMDEDGSNAFPSVGDNNRGPAAGKAWTTLTGRSRSVLLGHLAVLRDSGYLQVVKRRGSSSERLATLPHTSGPSDPTKS